MIGLLLGAYGYAQDLADRIYAAKSPAEQQVDRLYGPGVFQQGPRPVRPAVTLFDQIALGASPDEDYDDEDPDDEPDDDEEDDQ